MKLLHYHKRTSDPSLAPLFNPFFQKLRGIYDTGTRWYRKTLPMKYWRADLRIDGEHLSVELIPRDEAGFEFFTTGKPVSTGSVTQGGYTLTSLKACAVHTRVVMEDESVRWVTEIRGAKRSTDGTQLSIVERPFQVQLLDEPVREVPPRTYILDRPKFRTLLFETWAPGTAHSGVHVRNPTQGRGEHNMLTQWVTGLIGLHGTLQGAKGAATTHLLRDVLYDTPWATSKDGQAVTFALLNSDSLGSVPTPRTDWPRASGVQTVTSATHGTREFAIYIDAFNQVSAFPTGHNHAPNGVVQNVDQVYVKTVDMGLPAWVWQPATRLEDHYAAVGNTGILEFPEADWKVNHLGTKAVSICYTKVDASIDTFWTGTADTATTQHVTNGTGVALRGEGSVSGDPQRHWIAPGLVEIAITIVLTGPNPEDFTLTVTPTTLRDPATDTHGATLFAGYVWYDMPDGSASAGDLCVWDVERYYRLPDLSELHPIPSIVGTTSYNARVGGHVQYDPERACLFQTGWGASWAADNNLVGSPVHADVTFDTLKPYAADFWRTLYSLKNVTKGTELRTLPGCPSGVTAAYLIPPQGSSTLQYGTFASPVGARGQFLKADMTTLSFVVKYHVGTVDWRTHAVGLMDWYVLHPAVAVWTQNTLRETFYPDSMPADYVAPVGYTEPAQTGVKERLKTIIEHDFRATYMAGHTWTLLTLGGGPTSWDVSPDMNAMRSWIQEFYTTWRQPQISTDLTAHGGTTYPFQEAPAALSMWVAALGVFGHPISFVAYSNPHFHWGCYADLIENALMVDPFQCFFTHPNGTWAYFDQSNFYNRNGLPQSGRLQFDVGGNDYSTQWSLAKLEHWIIDRVHLCFTLPHKTVSKDTSFIELYNEAVANLPQPHTETFSVLAPADFKAAVTIKPTGTVSVDGLSLQLVWHGNTYTIGEDSVPVGTGNFQQAVNGSTLDLSTSYLWGGVVPQLVGNHASFSSCILIEAL